MAESSITRMFCTFLLALSLLQTTSCGSKNNDGAIQTDINIKTQSDPNLTKVSTIVEKGTVILAETCPDEYCRINVEKSIKDVAGVKKVVNSIAVAPAQIIDDKSLCQSNLQTNIS